MKLVFTALVLTFLICCTEAHKFDHVRKYLAEHDESSEVANRNAAIEFPNSNKIGLGYNPLYGSPVCYSGRCQGDGFRRSVFKLNYRQSSIGSCTSKLIPDFVELDCIPSSDLQTSTETISTLQQLSESTSKGVSFGVDVKYQMFSAGYSYSSETRFVTDEMMKQKKTAMLTRGKVTLGKLSAFEPFMELADTFQYVIEEMPCCDNDSVEIDNYIHEFLIDYFGLTFVTELMLGGIAQEITFIDNKEMQIMQSKGEDVSHLVNIGFFLTFNIKPTSSYNKTQVDQFMQSEKITRSSSKLGGDPSAQTMDDWIKSVAENPVVMNYAVKDISKLLSRERFPNDSYIDRKLKLVEMAIQRYLDRQKPICFNNCTDLNHGQCNVSNTAPFLLGTCQCQLEWKGNDCSETAISPIQSIKVVQLKFDGYTLKVKPIYCSGGLIHVENVTVYSKNSDIFNVWGGYNCHDENGDRRGTVFVETKNKVTSMTWNNPVERYLWNENFCLTIFCANSIFKCTVTYSAEFSCLSI